MPKWSPLDPETDRRLVSGLNEGNDKVLAALYDAYAERLNDYCASMVQEVRPAADIVHDVFVDASRRAPRMRNRLGLRAWLYGAARRRCLRFARAKARGAKTQARGLSWEWNHESDSEPSPREREFDGLLTGALGRLSFADQEVAVLVLRHELTAADLAAVLGISPCRANLRVRQVRGRVETAVADEVTDRCLNCAEAAGAVVGAAVAIESSAAEGAKASGVVEAAARVSAGGDLDRLLWPQEGDELAEHVDGCADCLERRPIDAEMLLIAPPAAVLPAALRHRVLHTGSDPELAAYRADIVARGGGLTANGMPKQPDVTPPIARRWLFTGGATAGSLAAAMVAALLIGPGIPGSNFFFPYISRPGSGAVSPGPVAGTPSHLPGRSMAPQAGRGRSSPNPGPWQIPIPRPEGDVVASPSPRSPGQPSPAIGDLIVSPSQVQLGGVQRTAEVDLTASGGPVSWTASSSSPQLQLSSHQGTLSKDGVYPLAVSLQPALLLLPGQARVLITDAVGRQQTVAVSWTLGLP